MKAPAAALTIFLSVVCASPQSPNTQPKPWPQEPTSFLGIHFGQPLRASIVECPKVEEYGSARYDWVGFGRPCFEVKGKFYEVDNLSPFFHISVEEIDGKVEYIGAAFNNGNGASLATVDAEGIASALIEKYGPPLQSDTETVQTKAGAAFQNKIMAWKGANVEVSFESVAGEYNHGYVSASTRTYSAMSAKRGGQGRDAVKGIL